MSTPTKPAESTATTVKLPFKPKAPKFGGIKEVGTDLWAAWTGGKPRADLASLRVSTPGSIDPNQFRANSISAQAKSKVYRTQGLETKFTRDSDVLTFQKKVMKHLVSYGLDTITYLKDPTTSGSKVQVVSVIDHHAKFDVKDATKEANTLMTNGTWDAYDLDNIRDAKEFLLNSISEDLETQLYENCEDTDSFSAYWLQLIHIDPQLDEILANFVHVRLGLYPFPLDEFEAAVKAIQIYFLDHTKDNKNAGNGVWTFPAIHMLHGHMIQRGITPFSFDPNDAKDEEVRLGIRAKNSKSIWTTAKKTKAAADDPGKKVLCKIETRGSVIQELIGFVNNFYGHDIEGPVEDEGPDPAEATRTEQDPATKRLKRTFHLG